MKKWLFSLLAILNFLGALAIFSNFSYSLSLLFKSGFDLFFLFYFFLLLFFVVNGIYFSKVGFGNLKQNKTLKFAVIFSSVGFILFLIAILSLFIIGVPNNYGGLIIAAGYIYGGAAVLGIFNLIAFIFVLINYFKTRKKK